MQHLNLKLKKIINHDDIPQLTQNSKHLACDIKDLKKTVKGINCKLFKLYFKSCPKYIITLNSQINLKREYFKKASHQNLK